ncbi:MAG: ABC transporter permease [Dysgonamonadaceae bacterium]|jgi:ABC-2 type transport system permease protein|nr:ABC transporter permease [Dysgonamonadaceae bacterium]
MLENKIGIVIGREYMSRVRKKSFLLMTVLMPLLLIGLIGGTLFLANVSDDNEKVIQVFDSTGEYYSVLQNTEQYRFVCAEDEWADFRKQSDIPAYAYLIITGNLLENPNAISLLSERQLTTGIESLINFQLNNYLSNKKLSSYNIPNIDEILRDSRINLNLKAEKIGAVASKEKSSEKGKHVSASAETASAAGVIFTFLIYMFIMVYGAMVMQGVMEEKTNRIVEIIVSSVKPFDLMMGKLIGIGLVGLTQFGIWATCIIAITSCSVFLGSSPVLSQIFNDLATVNLAEMSLLFVLFFIGGYMIYASLFAAIGAIVNSPEDSQQYMMPVTFLIIFAFFAGSYSTQNPDGPLAFWTSLIPFTSPIVMMIRLPFDVPWWQLLLSVTLLFATVVLTVALVAKIYRTGILMYGKKPTWGELIKWLKY